LGGSGRGPGGGTRAGGRDPELEGASLKLLEKQEKTEKTMGEGNKNEIRLGVLTLQGMIERTDSGNVMLNAVGPRVAQEENGMGPCKQKGRKETRRKDQK